MSPYFPAWSNPMLEVELKFQVPKEKRELLLKAMQHKNVQRIHLQAKYFDSPNFDLSQHKISLRQRLEGEHWVQTLKIPTEHHLQRAEFEHPITTLNPAPRIEKSENHAQQKQTFTNHHLELDDYQKNKSIHKKIRQLLSNTADKLQIQFETDVERCLSLFQFQNSQIEVSVDLGHIFAHHQSIDIFEIEFELKDGTIQDLISFILPRIKRYHLWLDIRSKAQHGFQLAQNLEYSPVQQQTLLKLNIKDSKESALKKMINNTLHHLLPNATAIASQDFNSEHIHQARVAIRRLRTVLGRFSQWSPQVDSSWAEQLAYFFRALGLTRDMDVFIEEILPQINLISPDELNFDTFKSTIFKNSSTQNKTPLDQIFRSADFTNLILSLLQFIHQSSDDLSQNNLQKSAIKIIQKLHQKTLKDAENFLELDIEARHRTRKHLKKMRYSIELISSLFSDQKVKKYLKSLKKVQQLLGQYNDLIVAEDLLKTQVEIEPKAWFAIGWITANQALLLQQSATQLKKFAQVKPFWL